MGLTDGNSTTAVATATATAAAVATAAPTYCNTVSGITVRIISLRSPHLVGYQYLALRDVDAAVDSACGLYSIPRQQPPSPRIRTADLLHGLRQQGSTDGLTYNIPYFMPECFQLGVRSGQPHGDTCCPPLGRPLPGVRQICSSRDSHMVAIYIYVCISQPYICLYIFYIGYIYCLYIYSTRFVPIRTRAASSALYACMYVCSKYV